MRVDARGHLAGEEGHDHRVAGIGAAVGDHVDADADQRAVAARAQLDVLDLRAPVLHRDHRLPAALDVAHRLAQAQRRRGHRGLLGIGGDARAEAAADVGRPSRGRRPSPGPARRRRRRARCAGACSGAQMRTPPVSGSGTATVADGSIGTAARRWLTKRLRTTTSAPSSAPSSALPPSKARFEPLSANSCGASSSSARSGSTTIVERLDVDLDELGGVDRRAAALGHDDRDRLALEAHDVARQRRAQHVVGRHRPRREGPEVEVGAGEHARRRRGPPPRPRSRCPRCARARPRSARSARAARPGASTSSV